MITEPSTIPSQVPPVSASNDAQENSTQEHNNQDKTDWNGLSVSTTTGTTPILVQGELNSTNEDTSKGAIAIQNSGDTEDASDLWLLYQQLVEYYCDNSETDLPSETIHSAVSSEIAGTPTAIITSDVDSYGNLQFTIPLELLQSLQPSGTSLEALVNAATQAYNQAMPHSASSGASEVQTNTADIDCKSATSLEEAMQIQDDTTCTDASETSSVTSNDFGINLVSKPDHENSTDSAPEGAITRSKRKIEQEEVLNFKRFRESMAKRAEPTGTSELLHLPGMDKETRAFLMDNITPEIINLNFFDLDQNQVKTPLALPTAPSGRLHQMHDRSVYIENKKESAAINSLSISAKISSAAGSYEKTIKQNYSTSDTTTLTAPLTQEPQGITENIDQKSDSGISEDSENITNQKTTDGNPTEEDKYRLRRDKNNKASRLSRKKIKEREIQNKEEINQLEDKNKKLNEKITAYEELAKRMKEKLTTMMKGK